jgi:hypothetical protein
MLLLGEDEVDNPAATDVNARFAAVGEDVGVVAASFFEGIRQDRHGGEVPLLVHPRRDPDGVFGAPPRIEGDAVERVAEDVAEESGSSSVLLCPRVFR